MTRYVFDKEKLISELQPIHINEIWRKMKLTPSQMITFWQVEPNVERLLNFKNITGLDPFEFVVKTGKRYK